MCILNTLVSNINIFQFDVFLTEQMDENTTDDWRNSLEYLSSLVNLDHIPKVDFKYFDVS